MNVMDLERIEHDEAVKVCEGTSYNALDLMDFQSVRDLKKQLLKSDEETARKAFKEYFTNLIIGLDDIKAED